MDSNNQAVIPDYYNVIEAPNGKILALDPVWDNTTYQDTLTGVTIINTDSPGYVPSNILPAGQTITSTTTIHGGGTAMPFFNSVFVGDLLFVQIPATSGVGQDHNPPQMTSRQCYNPAAAIRTKRVQTRRQQHRSSGILPLRITASPSPCRSIRSPTRNWGQ